MFLFRPAPQLGESLSSWRQRCGIANGFYRFPRPPGYRNFQEPDRCPKAAEVQWLKDEFRVADDILQPLFLDGIGGRFGGDFENQIHHHWIIPAYASHVSGGGSTCCPFCVSEDPKPYIRLSWRFAFLTHCPVHGCALVDRCTHCAGTMWPTSIKSIGLQTPYPFSHCQACGTSIIGPTDSDPVMQVIAQELWICASTGKVPDSLGQAANAQDVFAALWTVSQMLLRKRTAMAWDVLAPDVGELLRTWDGKRYIELLPVNIRAEVVRNAYFLLSDWPNTFFNVATAAGLQRQHFSENWDLQPIWLKSFIQKNLTTRTIGISRETVKAAIDTLQQDGVAVSKSSLRRLLGVTEAKAIHELVPHRRRATLSEFVHICTAFEAQVTVAVSSRDKKATLTRDYLVFLLSVLGNSPIESVCQMAGGEVSALLREIGAGCQNQKPEYAVAASRAFELEKQTEQFIRPRNASSPHRFTARNGGPLAGHTVRDRLAKLMKASLNSELWNSADVFLGLFDVPEPPSTRR